MATNFLTWFDQACAANPNGEAVAGLKPLIEERRADLEKQDSLDGIRAVVQQQAQERNLPNLVAAFDTLAAQYASDNGGKNTESAPAATGDEFETAGLDCYCTRLQRCLRCRSDYIHTSSHYRIFSV